MNYRSSFLQILPLAGKGTRFRNAGYETPKFLLELGKRAILEWQLSEMDVSVPTLLILNYSDDVMTEVYGFMKSLRFVDFDIVQIGDTEGQMESVYEGLKKSKYFNRDYSAFIFNGDTIRLGRFPFSLFFESESEIFVEVFEQGGTHWSFVDSLGKVGTISEKVRISSLCSTGLYGFRSTKKMCSTFSKLKPKKAAEYYVSALISVMLEDSAEVESFLSSSDNFFNCGTPEEYLSTKNMKSWK